MEIAIMSIKMIVYTALLTALTIAGAYLAIPIGPVPIVLQNFFVLLTGLLLGSRWGLASIGFYLLLGIIGLPVFSRFGAGISHIFGPTGGFLLSYIPAVFLIGLISEQGRHRTSSRQTMLWDIFALSAGVIIIYSGGLFWLKWVTKMDWSKTLATGFLPFIGFDIIKLIAALLIAPLIRPLMNIIPANTTASEEKLKDSGNDKTDHRN